MMRTKNFIKTVKELISSFFNLPQDSTIEDLTQPDGPLVPIVHWQMERCRMTFDENLPMPNIEVTVEGLPPIPPTYTGMRPPILLTASQAEQIVEMGGDLENVIICDRLPPIPEDCQVPTTTMPCSYGDYVQDDPMTTQIYLKSYPKIFETSEARQKMHNCRYFANSPHLKCTANPTNTNCLECNEYEHHNSNEMDS